MAPGEHPKQYSESIGLSSKEKVTLSIQCEDDEKAIQREASKIHEKFVNEN